MSDSHSRREFMGLTVAGVAGVFTPSWLSGGHSPSVGSFSRWLASARRADPELLVLNAKVYTMDTAVPRAEAFAISGGRIVAVGTTADIRGLARKGTQTYDAKQMTIVPGFTDCHNPAGGTTLLYEVLVGNPF